MKSGGFAGTRSTLKMTSKIIMVICDTWSSVMFAVLFFVNMYWFIMYKMQDHCYLLLPTLRGDSNAYSVFFNFFLITLICKTIAILITIIDQSTAEVFVIDWETSVDLVPANEDAMADKANQIQEQANQNINESMN
jgi:hypothetical protein